MNNVTCTLWQFACTPVRVSQFRQSYLLRKRLGFLTYLAEQLNNNTVQQTISTCIYAIKERNNTSVNRTPCHGTSKHRVCGTNHVTWTQVVHEGYHTPQYLTHCQHYTLTAGTSLTTEPTNSELQRRLPVSCYYHRSKYCARFCISSQAYQSSLCRRPLSREILS